MLTHRVPIGSLKNSANLFKCTVESHDSDFAVFIWMDFAHMLV